MVRPACVNCWARCTLQIVQLNRFCLSYTPVATPWDRGITRDSPDLAAEIAGRFSWGSADAADSTSRGQLFGAPREIPILHMKRYLSRHRTCRLGPSQRAVSQVWPAPNARARTSPPHNQWWFVRSCRDVGHMRQAGPVRGSSLGSRRIPAAVATSWRRCRPAVPQEAAQKASGPPCVGAMRGS